MKSSKTKRKSNSKSKTKTRSKNFFHTVGPDVTKLVTSFSNNSSNLNLKNTNKENESKIKLDIKGITIFRYISIQLSSIHKSSQNNEIQKHMKHIGGNIIPTISFTFKRKHTTDMSDESVIYIMPSSKHGYPVYFTYAFEHGIIDFLDKKIVDNTNNFYRDPPWGDDINNVKLTFKDFIIKNVDDKNKTPIEKIFYVLGKLNSYKKIENVSFSYTNMDMEKVWGTILSKNPDWKNEYDEWV